MRQVVEIDTDDDGTPEPRQTTAYVNDAEGIVLEPVSETDEGADGSTEFRTTSAASYDKDGNQVQFVRAAREIHGRIRFRGDGTIDQTTVVTKTYDGVKP